MLRFTFRTAIVVGVLIIPLILPPDLIRASDQAAWLVNPEFGEASFTETIPDKIRIHVNAPLDADGKPAKGTRLIVFALPNGNTLEQTLGTKMTPGLDWHYDIQHIAAQVRMLRTLMPDEKIVLVCAEAPGLSWPSYRKNTKDANIKIGRLLEFWREEYGIEKAKVTLVGHSGGGSFMFGVIESAAAIPASIDRIAFLDSNYSFDAALHAKKLEDWLKGNDSRRLIVICYDDREITLNGKKVVSDTGGTYRATSRMHDAFEKVFDLNDSKRDPFLETVGLDGRIHFYKHPNPENKILHTVLVGDMNGLLQAATLGTPQEGKWGTFGGPRAFSKFIQAEPTPTNKPREPEPAQPNGQSKKLESSTMMKFPERPTNAIGGAEFAKQVAKLTVPERDAAILREITSGNFPEFLRTFKKVEIHGRMTPDKDGPNVTAVMEVAPDYLAIGSDDDFMRMPMMPQTAQLIADKFGCVLPTRKMVDAIDSQAELKLEPHPMTVAREAVTTFVEQNQFIEGQRAGKPLGLLTIGTKKDIVLTPRIFEKPHRLAIYGWRQLNGQAIQPLTIVHGSQYVDYSHGVRLVRDTVEVDGKPLKIAELLADPERCALVSDEGPMNPPRYPAD